jgi:hypothetical protein
MAMDQSFVCHHLEWRSAWRSIWRVYGLKPAATAINTAVLLTTLGITKDKSTALIAFFIYCMGSDLVFGRCPGMMLCGTRWIGHPNIGQKLIYNTSYTLCFALMLANEIACALVMAAQIIAVLVTGKTTHGLLANMNSGK